MPSTEPRSTKWVFTMWPKENYSAITMVNNVLSWCNDEEHDVAYCIIGRETCPSTGLKHLQGYIHWNGGDPARKYRSYVKREILQDSTAHCDAAKGDDHQNKAYCSKEGDVILEFGAPTDAKTKGREGGLRTKAKWDAIRGLAVKGALDGVPSDIFIKHYSTLKRIGEDSRKVEPSIQGELTNRFLWIYGQPGTGKSLWVRSMCERVGVDLYNKTCSNKWWDGWKSEPIVIFDDFSRDDAKHLGGKFKNWADHYVFRAEIKGGSIEMRPQFIVVTSNYAIDDVDFPDEITKAAMKRRFRELEMVEENVDQFTAWEQFFSLSDAVFDWKHNKIIVENQAEVVGDDGELGIDVENESLGSVAEEREQEAAGAMLNMNGTQCVLGDAMEFAIDLTNSDDEESE